MDWKSSLKETSRKWIVEVAAAIISAAILYGLRSFIPQLSETLAISTWIILWVAVVITLLIVTIFVQRHQSRSPAYIPPPVRPGAPREEGGEAYIFLKVEPKESASVAQTLSRRDEVEYAAAVWGQWDIIIRVQTGNARSLIGFLRYLQGFREIKRTDTYIVRQDQSQTHVDATEEHWAFLLLRLSGQRADASLEKISRETKQTNRATIQHAVGILGQYDIILTVRYDGDEQLRILVMDYIQHDLQAETTTMPAIRNMVYKHNR